VGGPPAAKRAKAPKGPAKSGTDAAAVLDATSQGAAAVGPIVEGVPAATADLSVLASAAASLLGLSGPVGMTN
jgi:hypothetical protein